MQPTEEEEAVEVEEDETEPETGAITGEPEPEAPSSDHEPQDVMDSLSRVRAVLGRPVQGGRVLYS